MAGTTIETESPQAETAIEQNFLVLQRSEAPATVQLSRARVSIGSDPDCDLRLLDPAVARMHALIVVGQSKTVIRGLAEGIMLNGAPLTEAEIQPGDMLRVGDSQVIFLSQDQQQAEDQITQNLESAAADWSAFESRFEQTCQSIETRFDTLQELVETVQSDGASTASQLHAAESQLLGQAQRSDAILKRLSGIESKMSQFVAAAGNRFRDIAAKELQIVQTQADVAQEVERLNRQFEQQAAQDNSSEVVEQLRQELQQSRTELEAQNAELREQFSARMTAAEERLPNADEMSTRIEEEFNRARDEQDRLHAVIAKMESQNQGDQETQEQIQALAESVAALQAKTTPELNDLLQRLDRVVDRQDESAQAVASVREAFDSLQAEIAQDKHEIQARFAELNLAIAEASNAPATQQPQAGQSEDFATDEPSFADTADFNPTTNEPEATNEPQASNEPQTTTELETEQAEASAFDGLQFDVPGDSDVSADDETATFGEATGYEEASYEAASEETTDNTENTESIADESTIDFQPGQAPEASFQDEFADDDGLKLNFHAEPAQGFAPEDNFAPEEGAAQATEFAAFGQNFGSDEATNLQQDETFDAFNATAENSAPEDTAPGNTSQAPPFAIDLAEQGNIPEQANFPGQDNIAEHDNPQSAFAADSLQFGGEQTHDDASSHAVEESQGDFGTSSLNDILNKYAPADEEETLNSPFDAAAPFDNEGEYADTPIAHSDFQEDASDAGSAFATQQFQQAPEQAFPEQGFEEQSFDEQGFEEQGQASGGDEETSIEDYMAQLMNRVRGMADDNERKLAPTPAVVETPKRESPQMASLNDVAQPENETTAEPEQPKAPRERVAPPEQSSLAAMRDLANMSTRGALATHTRNQKINSVQLKLIAAVASLVGSLVLLWFSHTSGDTFAYVGSVGSMLVAIYFGVRYLMLTGQLFEGGGKNKKAAAEAPPEQETPSAE